MIEATIARRELQARDILVLDLVAAGPAPLPPYTAGAHIDVEIEPGLTRQYSLCGDPARGAYRIGVLKDPNSRGGSVRLHETFAAGRTIRIGAPRNLFPLAEGAPEAALVGGGIGVTPMIAMAHTLHAAKIPFTLHYCARTRESAAFLGDLAAAPFADRVRLHFDDAGPKLCAADLPDPAGGAHLYTCGPAGFMDHVMRLARDRGYPGAALHQEFFSAEADASGGGFEVELARSGRVVPVAEGQTIVAALAGAGVTVEVSCEQGICGACLCDVLSGEPDHRDSFLTADEKAEGDQMTLCCSRARSARLVLDL